MIEGDGFSKPAGIVLSLRAAGQWIVHAVVQAANGLIVVSFLVDFETGSQKKLGRKLFDCEPDGIRRVPKSSVSDRSSPGFLLATGEQLRRGVIIEFDHGLFDRGVLDRHLFERDLSDHAFFSFSPSMSWRRERRPSRCIAPASSQSSGKAIVERLGNTGLERLGD